MPGRVYRNEAISARAHMMFHQVEGIFIDEGVSFADLKQTVYYFVQEMFELYRLLRKLIFIVANRICDAIQHSY
jgi:phenylalanyl-tRNA synthetase alpha subunit